MTDKTSFPETIHKIYELDFGDTNLITTSKQDILDWIEADMHDLKEDSPLEYTITTKMITQKELDELPEWN